MALQLGKMKSMALGMCLAWLVLIPVCALGDGGFIPSTAFQKVEIPDQRALIHFADGKETLVIDTAFKGNGTNFAWIIPVPSMPTVEPATTGLFSTLQMIFKPRIVHNVTGYYKFAIFLGILVAYVLWKGRRGESPTGMLLIVALFAILSSLLLPALGTTASASLSGDQVSVLQRKTVGVYETATLSSRDGQAVFDWLNQNGFVAPTNFIPAIRAYAQEGWYFVASKIRLDASLPEGAKPHPLMLTFKTDHPVYPLRLTGINNDSCRIELYVFGKSRAQIPHFEVERCTKPAYPRGEGQPAVKRLEGIRIRHPLLRKLVDGSPVATKLTGQLSSRQMQEDAYIAWTPFREKQLTRYSEQGAAVTAANFAVPVLMLGLLGLLCTYWVSEKEPALAKQAYKVSGAIILTALACWGAIYLCLPKINVAVSRFPGIRMSGLHKYTIPAGLAYFQTNETTRIGGAFKPDAAWVRQQLAETSEWRRGLESRYQTNLFSGQLWREEDSPGNYTIREATNGVEYVWYDLEGGEHIVPLFIKTKKLP
jgi:hypothetical protein